MYLLAEDEGNEEEILRLLETASPSRDVVTCAVGCEYSLVWHVPKGRVEFEA